MVHSMIVKATYEEAPSVGEPFVPQAYSLPKRIIKVAPSRYSVFHSGDSPTTKQPLLATSTTNSRASHRYLYLGILDLKSRA